MSDEFKKWDKGKPRPDLIPPQYLWDMGKVMALGAAKYGEYNWQLCEDPRRYLAALDRHLLQYKMGLLADDESNESHLVHVGCCAAMAYELGLRK